jgi:hypothetical protein
MDVTGTHLRSATARPWRNLLTVVLVSLAALAGF